MRLQTERLTLRGARADKGPMLQEIEWLNDPEVVRYSEQRHKRHTLGTQYDYIRSFHLPDMLWEIHLTAPERLIGTFSSLVDRPNHTADLGILLGAKDCWGNGYGLEAWTAVMGFIREMPGIKRITGGCMEPNLAMQKIMLAAGMTSSGMIEDRFYFNGTWVDGVYFGATQ